MKLATQIKGFRTARNLTLNKVAIGTGLSLSYLSDLERGRTIPSISTLERIASFYGLRVTVRFIDNEQEPDHK